MSKLSVIAIRSSSAQSACGRYLPTVLYFICEPASKKVIDHGIYSSKHRDMVPSLHRPTLNYFRSHNFNSKTRFACDRSFGEFNFPRIFKVSQFITFSFSISRCFRRRLVSGRGGTSVALSGILPDCRALSIPSLLNPGCDSPRQLHVGRCD
jgi:hypothetical protein